MQKILVILATIIASGSAMNLDYLDPTKLQTRTTPEVQQATAMRIIQRYSNLVQVEVNHTLFRDNKDVFSLRTDDRNLVIRASSGVAAVWGFHYYLKKYCRSHISWQNRRVIIRYPLPPVNELVVANDRFRYYLNVCTFSYSFVWWNIKQWHDHVEWMAMNGINIVLAPIDQEAAWANVYKEVGMTDKEIDQHFTGPAFLSWLRMGNVHGWAGPLLKSWHDRQSKIQTVVTKKMYDLGIIPVLPSFSGHVPKAFSRIFPTTTFQNVSRWMNFSEEYCCALFLNPTEPLFKTIGSMFLREVNKTVTLSHIYSADPFNEVNIEDMPDEIIKETAAATVSVINKVDSDGVWLVQNWMFINRADIWTEDRVETFFSAVPNGKVLVLDLEAEHYPQYDRYDMYYGHPFIWCMLHNFGGTLGMIGKIPTINSNVYEVRSRENSTMIGIGLAPEGINQNYVVYDMMLETAWRNNSVLDLREWVADYAERRYGCNTTALAWNHLLQSVYSYNKTSLYGYNDYVMTRKPSLRYVLTSFYKRQDLFEAFRHFAFGNTKCNCAGFRHDLVDITRQALQYRAEQIYFYGILGYYEYNVSTYAQYVREFIDVLNDMEQILASNDDFTALKWLADARGIPANATEIPHYEFNARNQITLWGPNGEISDYARKQWAELFHYYYTPRWALFLTKALEAKLNNETFDEAEAQRLVMEDVEKKFAYVKITRLPKKDSRKLAKELHKKWANRDLPDLPTMELGTIPTLAPEDSEEITAASSNYETISTLALEGSQEIISSSNNKTSPTPDSEDAHYSTVFSSNVTIPISHSEGAQETTLSSSNVTITIPTSHSEDAQKITSSPYNKRNSNSEDFSNNIADSPNSENPIPNLCNPSPKKFSPNFETTSPNVKTTSANFKTTPLNFETTLPTFETTSDDSKTTSPNFETTSPNFKSIFSKVERRSSNIESTSSNFKSTSNVESTSPNVKTTSPNVKTTSPNVKITPTFESTTRFKTTSLNFQTSSSNLETISSNVENTSNIASTSQCRELSQFREFYYND